MWSCVQVGAVPPHLGGSESVILLCVYRGHGQVGFGLSRCESRSLKIAEMGEKLHMRQSRMSGIQGVITRFLHISPGIVVLQYTYVCIEHI